MSAVDLCPPVRIRHHDSEPEPYPAPMRGRHIRARHPSESMRGMSEDEWRVMLTREILADLELDPPAICSCCGRPLAMDLPRQYEIAGTWDNFGPASQREPCSPRYLSVCRQPRGVPDWEM